MKWFNHWWHKPLVPPLEPEKHSCTAKEIDDAVLRILIYRLPNRISENFAYWGSCSMSDVENCRAEVAKVREWSLSLEDKRVRNAYTKWLDVWDREADAAAEELQTHKMRLASERSREQQAKENQAIQDCVTHLPKPPKLKGS